MLLLCISVIKEPTRVISYYCKTYMHNIHKNYNKIMIKYVYCVHWSNTDFHRVSYWRRLIKYNRKKNHKNIYLLSILYNMCICIKKERIVIKKSSLNRFSIHYVIIIYNICMCKLSISREKITKSDQYNIVIFFFFLIFLFFKIESFRFSSMRSANRP